MGLTDAPPGGAAGTVCRLADTRTCLRPEACPYATAAPGLAGTPAMWTAALLDLMPGDAGLALDLVSALRQAARRGLM